MARESDTATATVGLSFKRDAMRTTFELILEGDRDAQALEGAAESVFSEVHRLERLLSAYIPTSDVRQINEHAPERPVPVHPDTFDILERSIELYRRTDGAFDITIGPLVKCWGFFQRHGAVPDPEDLEAARDRVGTHYVELDPRKKAVACHKPGVEINLGAIGKGFAIDKAAERLRELGFGSALIHAGYSTIYAMGQPASAEGWRIGVRERGDESPRIGYVDLRNQALSTSGSYVQAFQADGRTYGHVIDPRTGWPAGDGIASVAVIGPDPVAADALSTAFVVGGEQLAQECCVGRPEGAVIVREETPGKMRVYEVDCVLREGGSEI